MMALKVRNRVGLAAGAAALGLTVAALSVSVVSPAEAVADRRLCVYSYTFGDTSKAVFVNYKKTGACPEVDVNKFNDVVGMEVIGSQPVRKIVCEGGEAFLATDPKNADPFEQAATVKGIDLCLELSVDVVYRVTWSKAGGIRQAAVGAVRDFAPQPTG